MPLRNRVTPLSELVADPARGLVYGNRGCLHDDSGRVRRRFAGRRWIACRLRFKDWQRGPLLQPGRFTELFFLDEATAFAAGHRPCALCRREDYVRFGAIWGGLHPGQAGADEIDAQLHRERVDPATRAHRLHDAELAELPDGAFVLDEGAPWLVLGQRAAPLDAWRLHRAPAARSRGRAADHAAVPGRRPPGRAGTQTCPSSTPLQAGSGRV